MEVTALGIQKYLIMRPTTIYICEDIRIYIRTHQVNSHAVCVNTHHGLWAVHGYNICAYSHAKATWKYDSAFNVFCGFSVWCSPLAEEYHKNTLDSIFQLILFLQSFLTFSNLYWGIARGDLAHFLLSCFCTSDMGRISVTWWGWQQCLDLVLYIKTIGTNCPPCISFFSVL